MEGFVQIPGKQVLFHNEVCDVHVGRYPATGHICILLLDKDGEVFAKASTTFASTHLPSNHVMIKDYSENVGMPEALQEAGIIGPLLVEDPFPVHALLHSVPPPLNK
jgi:hypothetical protein